VLAPIVFWLGQTIPLTTNLFNQQHRVGQISGRALFLSTMGSFLGALLTSLLLFQYLGVAWTVVINCVLLFGLIIGLRKESHLTVLQGIFLFLVLGFIALLNLNAEKVQFKRTNNYANYQVIDSQTFDRLLQINRSNSSLLSVDGKGFPYIEFMRDLLFKQLNFHDKSMLIIGAGGFTLTASGTYGNQVTYVDIDPDIQKLVESDFLHHPINGSFVAEDARSYLQQHHAPFDVIISDAYTHRAAIPPSLLTIEYFKAIADHLGPNGMLIVNVISDPLFRDDYARIVYNSIHSVFTYCAVVPLAWKDPLTNVIYICPKVSELPVVYRDDLNNATQDFFNSSRLAMGG
jgi:spermidine synthase